LKLNYIKIESLLKEGKLMGLQNKIKNTLSSISKEKAKNQALSWEMKEHIENEELYKKIKRKGRPKITKPNYQHSSN